MAQGSDTNQTIAEYKGMVRLWNTMLSPGGSWGESTRAGTAAGKVYQEAKLGKTDTDWFGSHGGG